MPLQDTDPTPSFGGFELSLRIIESTCRETELRAFGEMNRRSDTPRCISVHSPKRRSASTSEYSTCSEWKKNFVALGSLGA